MNALVLNALHQPHDYQTLPDPKPAKGEAVVTLKTAALNHRDLWITKGQYASICVPAVLGSDGAGEYQGKPVIINPSISWGTDPKAQGKEFRVLGMPDQGTFAELISIPRKNIVPMPQHLNFEQAAALPLAGLTAYRAVFTRCQLKKGERVLISGIGGGVAVLALQLAVAAGAEVFVTSGSDAKIARAIAMGAKGGANYRDLEWAKQLKKDAGGFDVVIDSAAGDGFAALVGLCNLGGRVGIYGGTMGKINQLTPQMVFWKQASILGSTMGSPRDFQQMVAFVGKHQIVPVVDSVFTLAEGNQALARMEESAQFGKIVLSIA